MSTLVTASRLDTGQDPLPVVGDDGFFGVRFESIGGLGAHLAGRILAEACVLRQGFNGAHFSSYGSEKKGTPVKSFVRICPGDREVRTSSPIESPQVVAVFHEALVGSLDVAAGLPATGTLIMNSRKGPEEIRDLLGLRSGTVAVVDALGIALWRSAHKHRHARRRRPRMSLSRLRGGEGNDPSEPVGPVRLLGGGQPSHL